MLIERQARTLVVEALADPHGFIAGLRSRVLIDEVQRVPDLLYAIKEAVDENPAPGRFLLTGSANIFTAPTISESLAGRVSRIELWPLDHPPGRAHVGRSDQRAMELTAARRKAGPRSYLRGDR